MQGPDESELLEYTPTLPTRQWEPIKDFVFAAVNDCGDGKTAYGPKNLAMVTTRLVFWCRTTAAMRLDRTVIFDRRTIDRFTTDGLPGYTEASRGNLRSQLLRMSEILLDPREAPRKLDPLKAAEPSRPYAQREVADLRMWASTQSTPQRKKNAKVLLALGLGAGLTASEIGELTVGDIVCDDDGVSVHVRVGRVREVPVLHEWEAALLDRVRELRSDRFAFREGHTVNYDNLVSNFVGRSRGHGTVPQTQRMRASWIVRHLERGTPAGALVAAAGVDSLEAFTRYLHFVSPISADEARTILRG